MWQSVIQPMNGSIPDGEWGSKYEQDERLLPEDTMLAGKPKNRTVTKWTAICFLTEEVEN